MTANAPSLHKSLSRWLALTWFGLVGLAALGGALFVLIPSEALFVIGRARGAAYALAFILVVAIMGLPLLLIAALLDRKARRGAS